MIVAGLSTNPSLEFASDQDYPSGPSHALRFQTQTRMTCINYLVRPMWRGIGQGPDVPPRPSTRVEMGGPDGPALSSFTVLINGIVYFLSSLLSCK